MLEFQSTIKDFDLTVSVPKTKHVVRVREAKDHERTAITVSNGENDSVGEFCYFRSVVNSNGRVDTDIEQRMFQASRAFGAIRRAVFLDRTF